MKRRLLLMFGTFVLLLLACGVYYLVAGGGYSSDEGDPDFLNEGGLADPDETDEKQLVFMDRDKRARLRGMYVLPDWEKREDGSYVVIRPRIELYQRGGQQLTIQADRGTIYAEELARGANVTRGSLEGNVRLTFDRATEEDRAPQEDRPEDLIRFYTDHIEFDNDQLQISTDTHVTVFSPEVDILGKGLIIRWNDDPRELRLLMIVEGEYLAIKQVPGEVSLVPGGGKRSAGEEEGKRDSDSVLPLGEEEEIATLDDSGIFDSPPSTRSASVPAHPVTRPATAPATRPVTRPAGRRAKARAAIARRLRKASRRNIYRAMFHGDVRVRTGGGEVRGAEKLAMIFDWDTSRRSRSERKATTAPATSPATSPAGEPARSPEPRPAVEQLGEPIVITWTGPLVLEPIGYTPTPSDERFRIAAEGKRVVLSNEGITATCRQLLYSHPEQIGQLTGDETEPVRLQTDANEEVICGQMRFDANRELLHLAGPGAISSAGDAGFNLPGGFMSRSATKPTTQPAAGSRIVWSESVTGRFGTVEVLGDDGNTAEQFVITEAIFRGGVSVGQGGDSVRGDEFHVWLGNSADGQFPTKAVMSGDVSAHQGDGNEFSDLLADRVAILFEQRLEMGEDGELERTTEPRWIDANGNVSMIVSDANRVTTVVGDRMIVDVLRDTATLYGEPASVVQGDRMISGAEIRLVGAGEDANGEKGIAMKVESVTVPGEGKMALATDRDFAGEKLEKPQSVLVMWKGGMKFDGKEKDANFVGPVKFISASNSIECNEGMYLTFRDANEESGTAPGAGPEDEAEAREGAFEMEGMGKLRLATVQAKDDVVVLTHSLDDEGHILERRQLKTDSLFYDAEAGQIDIFQPGELLVEDYRAPKPDGEAESPDGNSDANAPSERIRRPWQTYFTWEDKMQLTLGSDSREVIMEGEVGVVHRSQSHVSRPKDLNLVPWGEMTDGRTTTLSCGKLRARFALPPEEPTATRPAGGLMGGDGTPAVGDLEEFTATGNVILRDGAWELQGARMTYNRSPGVGYLWGYVEGEEFHQASGSLAGPAIRRCIPAA